jgi:hypothetical protein
MQALHFHAPALSLSAMNDNQPFRAVILLRPANDPVYPDEVA